MIVVPTTQRLKPTTQGPAAPKPPNTQIHHGLWPLRLSSETMLLVNTLRIQKMAIGKKYS
jgi:hypothetical protein